MKKLEKRLENAQIEFIGEHSWNRFRDFLVLKMQECTTEEQFVFILKSVLGSCFTDADAIDDARKVLGLKLLSKKERKELQSKVRGKKDGRTRTKPANN